MGQNWWEGVAGGRALLTSKVGFTHYQLQPKHCVPSMFTLPCLGKGRLVVAAWHVACDLGSTRESGTHTHTDTQTPQSAVTKGDGWKGSDH